MHFWQGVSIFDLLLLGSLLAGWWVLRAALPVLRRSPIPDAIAVGTLGFMLGPESFELMPFDQQALQSIVYHGLALIFIAVALQSRPSGNRSLTVRSMAFAMPAMAVLQALCGLGIVIGWSLFAPQPIHAGFGLLLPLGFQQGPGQALSLGKAWEATGLAHGAALGLAFAATGFLVCAILGVVAVTLGRRRGWIDPAPAAPSVISHEARSATTIGGALRTIGVATRQVAAIATVYLATYGVVLVLARSLPAPYDHMMWGLHFVVAAGLALLARALLGQRAHRVLHDGSLAEISSLLVDFTTAGALIAVELSVLGPWLGPFLATILAGTLVTAWACWALAKRAFSHTPFQHAIVLFGASTGTLPTGLALLRMLDPHLRGNAARSIVLATPGAVLLGLPLLLVVMPVALSGGPTDGLARSTMALGLLVLYLFALLVGWALWGGLKWGAMNAAASP